MVCGRYPTEKRAGSRFGGHCYLHHTLLSQCAHTAIEYCTENDFVSVLSVFVLGLWIPVVCRQDFSVTLQQLGQYLSHTLRDSNSDRGILPIPLSCFLSASPHHAHSPSLHLHSQEGEKQPAQGRGEGLRRRKWGGCRQSLATGRRDEPSKIREMRGELNEIANTLSTPCCPVRG